MSDTAQVAAPGSVLVIRDETWLVTRVERATDGWFVDVQGLSELVRDTQATFSTALDKITVLDPARAEVVADDSSGYRKSRLWLDATLRKTAVPMTDPTLTVARQGLADALPYQLNAVRKALDPDSIRPRILLADAVGLGKTLEIGMILAELTRRGRGERILVVTPRHVLEQMQFELWTRFALPFVRLDSVGIQRIRRQLPATRNPFAHFKRAIVSIDTLKSDRYLAHLEKQHWDAVVIDESHNVTNSKSQNNRLARLLSSRTDALILASATPHNGKKESFAELVRMLEPSAVTPEGELVEEEVARLVIRRHRHSPDVAEFVGGAWAERLEPQHKLVAALPIENEIVDELVHTWLHPEAGTSPYSGRNAHAKLFPWTLAKAFLSSPPALAETIANRRRTLAAKADPDTQREEKALAVLHDLTERQLAQGSAKYDALAAYLREIGVAPTTPMRAVVFAERVATLHWLRDRLRKDLKLKDDQIVVLHGGISDVEQQEIVESFKQEASPIRVLVTGDVASEGVNLHLQCHQLIHYDIPWSLIRIEQRNGRIDRYGQTHPPVITTLLLDPTSDDFAGDVRVLRKLVEKEHEAHRALGDSASLMGAYDIEAEEESIRQVLARERDFDDVVRDVGDVAAADDFDGMLARLMQLASEPTTTPLAPVEPSGVYDDDLSFLRDALEQALITPGKPPPNGVSWTEHTGHGTVEFVPTDDLRQRLEVLPQTYLRERRVNEKLMLATNLNRGRVELEEARKGTMSWPEAHYLSPLHPALEWAADRALASLGRNQVFAVEGPVEHPSLLMHGTLTNVRGQVVAASFVVAAFPNPDSLFAVAETHASARAALGSLGVADHTINADGLGDVSSIQRFVAPGVQAGRKHLGTVLAAAEQSITERVTRWSDRVHRWEVDADALLQRAEVKERRERVAAEKEMARAMLPDQQLVRPLLLVVPVGFTGGGN